MRLLGVNSVYHESAAAVIVDGKLIAAAEEERFNRRKHGAEARVDNAHELPAQAIGYCLSAAGLDVADLDGICYSFDPKLRRIGAGRDPWSRPGDWGDERGEHAFLESLGKVPRALSELLGADVSDRVRWVPHHLAHAASAYYASGFERAGILVVDGIGERATALLGYGEGDRIEVLRQLYYPHSLGFLWEKLSKFLGFSEYDACKVMGLAAYGDSAAYRAQLERLIRMDNGGFRVAAEKARFRATDFTGLVELFGPVDPGVRRKHCNLAAGLQAVTDEVMMRLARAVYRRRPCDALCIAGGVGLNCHANWVVKQNGPFGRVYVPSAPHDAGTAVGAALYCFHSEARGSTYDDQSARSASTPYLGPSFRDAEIERSIRARRLSASTPPDIEREVATLVADGQVVGWFQDRMEFGPRALGNRSLVADPRDHGIREVLNRKVKHREPFRPFAPSVLGERAREWLDPGRDSESNAFMSFACPVHADRIARIPAVVHEDGTARMQLVDRRANPRFHRLIAEFERLTGVPLVLNTSFNDSEPIVCSPDDALDTFLATKIDAVALGDYLVRR